MMSFFSRRERFHFLPESNALLGRRTLQRIIARSDLVDCRLELVDMGEKFFDLRLRSRGRSIRGCSPRHRANVVRRGADFLRWTTLWNLWTSTVEWSVYSCVAFNSTGPTEAPPCIRRSRCGSDCRATRATTTRRWRVCRSPTCSTARCARARPRVYGACR